MKTVPLKARRRTEKGTRACRRLRRAGEIPVNLYGLTTKDGARVHENIELAASAYDVMQLIGKHASFLDVSFDGRTEMAVLREVQRDAFGDDVLHIDLVKVDPNQPVELAVDVVVRGESKGQRSGGRLLLEARQIHVSALPANMPAEIEVKVDDLEIGQALTVGQLQLPEGVTAIDDPEKIVVHVLAPMTEEELAAQATAATPAAGEPEVIGKKKEEAEEE